MLEQRFARQIRLSPVAQQRRRLANRLPRRIPHTERDDPAHRIIGHHTSQQFSIPALVRAEKCCTLGRAFRVYLSAYRTFY